MIKASDKGLVLDASVLINVIATQLPAALLDIGVPVLMPEVAFREVIRDPRRSRPVDELLSPLTREGRLRVVSLHAEEVEHYLGLVGAEPPDDLDDGESAAIACAVRRCCAIAIDDRKGRRILREQFPGVTMIYSVDLFERLRDSCTVEREHVDAAFDDARQWARMRVPNR